MNEKFEEPPKLINSDGEEIVQFRRPDGTIFSNHPEYELAKAIHERDAAAAAEAESAAEDDNLEDDEPQEPDNADGKLTYEEMTSHDLAALARERGIVDLPDRKRSTAIKALQDWDEAQAAKAGS